MKIDKRHLLWIMGAGIVGLDQLFKAIIRSHFAPGYGPCIIGVKDCVAAIIYAPNSGLFLGWLDTYPAWFLILFQGVAFVAGLVAIVMVQWLFPRRLSAVLAMVLVASGILTALIDRLTLGYVVDYLWTHGGIAVNLGDVAAGIGLIWLVAQTTAAGIMACLEHYNLH